MLKIVDYAGYAYKILDTDDNVTEIVTLNQLFVYKCTGINIQGCCFTNKGFFTEINGIYHNMSVDNIPETWLSVSGYRPMSNTEIYQVSNRGHVRYKSTETDNKWKSVQQKQSRGRYFVSLGFDSSYVDELVAITFMPSPSGQRDVAHINGDKLDSSVWNLEYAQEAKPKTISQVLVSKAPDVGLSGVGHLNRVLVVTGRHEDKFEVYDMWEKEKSYASVETLVMFKAKGGVVESCTYTGRGVRLVYNGKEILLDAEVFMPVRYRNYSPPVGANRYEVSNLGNVRYFSAEHGRYYPVVQRMTKDGFVVDLILFSHSDAVTFKVIDLVANAFVIKPQFAMFPVPLSSDMSLVSARDVGWKTSSNNVITDEDWQSEQHSIICYDTFGVVTGVYNNLRMVEDICRVETVQKCCETKSAVIKGGRFYAWRYVSQDDLGALSGIERIKKFPGKVIRQYDMSGKFVREWFSPKHAAEKLGLPREDIIKSCEDKTLKTICGNSIFQSIVQDKLHLMTARQREKLFPRVLIRQYKITGELVAEHGSVADVCLALGVERQQVCNNYNGVTTSLCGFVLRHVKKDDLFELSVEERRKKLIPYTIRQYELSGDFVREYLILEEIGQRCGIDPRNVKAVCDRQEGKFTTGGYVWRYSTDDELYNETPKRRVEIINSLSGRNTSIRGWSECDSWRDKLSFAVEKDYSKEPQFEGVPEELQKWYKTIQREKYGSSEQWAPAPLVNFRRRDGSWMYEVSNRGRVRRSDYVGFDGTYFESYELKLEDRVGKSPVAYLRDHNGVQKHVPVDRMVAIAFVKNESAGLEIIHLDGNVTNCSAENLSWGSSKDVVIEDAPTIESEVSECRKVRQYSPIHKLLAEYNSIQEAAEAVGGDPSSIIGACKDKCIYHRNFLWRFSDDDEVQSLSTEPVSVGEEVWKPVSAVDAKLPTGVPRYEVSNHGRLRRPSYVSKRGVVYEEKIYSLIVDQSGLRKHNFRMADGTLVNYLMAFLVATEFISNPNNLTRLQFIDGDLSNNRADNLIWSVAGYNRSIKAERRVRQYSLEGEFIKEFDSIADASAAVDGDDSSISRVCGLRYGSKSAHGYIWRYADNDEFDKGRSGVTPVLHEQERAVRQYSLECEFIQEFSSMAKAAEAVGGTTTDIYAACTGKSVTARNFMWRYADSDDLADNPVTAAEFLAERKANRKPMERKPNPEFEVRQYSVDGKLIGTYKTSRKAAEATGCNRSNIRDACARKIISALGFVWRVAKDDEFFDMSEEERVKQFSQMNIKAKRRGKRLRQYDSDKKFIAEHSSPTEASKATGVDRVSIVECCDRERKSGMSSGFYWRWTDDDEFHHEQ